MILFSCATDDVDSDYEDDLDALLQELEDSEREEDQGKQADSNDIEHEETHNQEESGERIQAKFPEKKRQMDKDKLVKLQWGAFRTILRIPRIVRHVHRAVRHVRKAAPHVRRVIRHVRCRRWWG